MGIRTRTTTALLSVMLLGAGLSFVLTTPPAAATDNASSALSIAECATTWRLVKTDTFRGADALTRSQGVTSDGTGWIFSWQAGVSRTDDNYTLQTAGVIPPAILAQPHVNADFTNHLGDVHIGGIDNYNGLIYAPVEDTGYSLSPLPLQLNNPEYQTPYMALLDAHTMQPTRKNIALDPKIHEAGVPWVAVNAAAKEVYTGEWDQNHQRLNVFNTDMKFKRFLPLVYPASLGADFKLSRIQGAKVLGNTLFAARDDDAKTIYAVDLTTGVVSKKFAINRPGDEIEGLTIRPTGDGALLHVLVVRDGDDYVNAKTKKVIRVEFQHWAPVPGEGCDTHDDSLAGMPDVANMLKFEDLMTTGNMQQGHAVEVDFDSAQRIAGHVVGTGGWGDSGLWTGVYLGGQAMRYQVAKKHIADPGASASDVAFWQNQKAEAMSRVREILKAEHIDINIAEDWTGKLIIPPQINTKDNPLDAFHVANFGGGIIHGEKGMIQRACTPVGLGAMGVSDPTNYPDDPINNNDNRVFQITWKHGDGKTYNCETSPSRDTYAGLTFGLLTTFDMVGPDAPDLRDQIRADLLSMGNFLFKYGWAYPRPHGYVSVEHDFNGFISPLFVYTPEAQLNVANAVRHVADNGGSLADKVKWDAIWKEDFATLGGAVGASVYSDSLTPHDSYYKWNLSHLNAFNLLRTTHGAEHDVLALGMSAMDKTTKNDVNAHFEAIMYALTGEQQRLDQSMLHLRQWLDYRANIEAGPVKNSVNCGHTIMCVHDDHAELDTPLATGGSLAYRPGSQDPYRAKQPLPVASRTPTDFLWQRSPDQLDGYQPPTHRMPGIDFLTPYWMLRYFTEVAPPGLHPLPEWPLPGSN